MRRPAPWIDEWPLPVAYSPASAGEAVIAPEAGALWPLVGVGVIRLGAGSDLAVCLHVTGTLARGLSVDEEVFLRPSEAEALAQRLLAAAGACRG